MNVTLLKEENKNAKPKKKEDEEKKKKASNEKKVQDELLAIRNVNLSGIQFNIHEQ